MVFISRLVILAFIILSATAASIFFSLRTKEAPPVSQTNNELSQVSSNDVPLSETQVEKVHSPNGRMRLFMEKTKTDDSYTYSYSASDDTEVEKKLIFTKTLPQGSSMEISQNTWSPDNKYFFITEKTNSLVNYLVFRADGEFFGESEQYIDVVPLFVAKNTGYTLSEITGWDSETLLHAYTTKEDGSRGPSFWFEVPSKAIIQLASR